ncbi:MAG: PHB depolymerase family esterase, partial [Acidimicrobiales bacterium]|nr:PHB depolymerase family esterase [Acidimicrobiales bacterium]
MQLHRLTVDGQDRSYRVFVPPTLDRSRPAPLVMVLHGGNNTPEDMAKTTLFDREAAAGDFIAAYPEGVGRAWNAGTCCGAAPRRGLDDV